MNFKFNLNNIDNINNINNIDKLHNKFILENNGNPLEPNINNPWWSMLSHKTNLGDVNKDNIILITQFYIDKDNKRQKEILETLKYNVNNKNIDKILLFNEKIYTKNEMNLTDNDLNKITQINIGKRLKFNDIFNYIEDNKIKGYIIIANSDIFFDDNLFILFKTNLINEKKIFSLLRFEHNKRGNHIFGPRGDSQDTWIFHSNYNIKKEQSKIFNFELGIPGCDNHIIYLFMILGYKVYNEPYLIKTYHNHETQKRNYNNSTKRITKPWIRLIPVTENKDGFIDRNDNWWRFNIIEENLQLFNYIKNKLNNNKNFIIPRIAGVENNYAQMGMSILNNRKVGDNEMNYIKNTIGTMKNNAGIKLSDINSIIKYSQLYLEAFNKCDIYFEWDPWGDVYKYIKGSHDFININFKNKKRLWAFTLDIFHNIYNNPWTQSLKGKRLLIVSPFKKSFEEKLPVLKEIYGVDLFPDCSFIFIKPPQTQGDCESKEFDKELDDFIHEVEKIKDDFDIALCSCGGYGNLVCSKIYDMNKSAIYVGGVLQMYFGVYGSRWMRERGAILRLFMNKHWSRPKEEEQPDGFKKVEGSCYW